MSGVGEHERSGKRVCAHMPVVLVLSRDPSLSTQYYDYVLCCVVFCWCKGVNEIIFPSLTRAPVKVPQPFYTQHHKLHPHPWKRARGHMWSIVGWRLKVMTGLSAVHYLFDIQQCTVPLWFTA